MKTKLLLDGLSVIPYYDFYLMQSLGKRDKSVRICVTTYLRDKSVSNQIDRKIKCFDFIYNTKLANTKFSKGIKAIEYIMNLFLITIQALFKKIELIHIEWLPLLNKPFTKSIEIFFVKVWKRSGVKLVYTVHNILPHDSGKKYYELYSYIYKISDQLICHTNYTAMQLIDKFDIDKKKINVIPHGPMFQKANEIDKSIARSKLKLPNKKTILLLGFLRPYKGIDFLLNTFKKVLDDYGDNINLVIVGDGEKKYIEKIQDKENELGIYNNITNIFKFVSQEEVQLFHYASDIVVFPYKSIDQSGALYTAMATKRPIIATSVGGFKEVISDGINGCLIKYGDVDEFTNKIIYLLNNDQVSNKFAIKNLELLKNKYSWDIIAQKTLQVYKK